MNSRERRITSPNGRMDAVMYIRDAGATTGSITHVSVLPVGRELPDTVGNAFIYDAHYAGEQESRKLARVEWVSDVVLAIHYDRGFEVIKSVHQVDDVTIEYRPR